jgi:hypothetical protein
VVSGSEGSCDEGVVVRAVLVAWLGKLDMRTTNAHTQRGDISRRDLGPGPGWRGGRRRKREHKMRYA